MEEFVDDGGHSLIAPPPDPKQRFPTPRAPGIVFGHMMPVANVEGAGRTVTKLKGSIRGYALTAAEALEVETS